MDDPTTPEQPTPPQDPQTPPPPTVDPAHPQDEPAAAAPEAASAPPAPADAALTDPAYDEPTDTTLPAPAEVVADVEDALRRATGRLETEVGITGAHAAPLSAGAHPSHTRQAIVHAVRVVLEEVGLLPKTDA